MKRFFGLHTPIYIQKTSRLTMMEFLPEHLVERCVKSNNVNSIESKGPVVVWLKSSHRFHENPAIDVAKHFAIQHDLEMFVYQGIDERYPHSSLRHHNMLLDAASDMAKICRENDVSYYLHVARKTHRPKVLFELAKTSSIIITDLFPLPPWNNWVKNIANSASCPVLEVDCHCVIPMPIFGKSVDRPFKFRSATKKMRKLRLDRHWPAIHNVPRKFEGELPFIPVDIEKVVNNRESRFQLLQQCEIDPTVFPVWEQKGGEIVALKKWDSYLKDGIGGYSRRRNNAADQKGVSKLSYAFHYGFLSPMKVAREASALGTKSAEKYLDELLIFREHAWHHIYACSDPYSTQNLPTWALDSWRETEDDVRSSILPLHRLEYSESSSKLWNYCQKSLTRHGELHNNLRMTWGKALPRWTSNLEISLSISQMLNDKYALDGRDPSSVVGVQWCHGLFDRPFYPSVPVMGIIRKREIETHESRLDTEKYYRYVNRLNSAPDQHYVVKVNSVCDAYAARVLKDNGLSVEIISSENAMIDTISKRDIKSAPIWARDRLESILRNTNETDMKTLKLSLSSGVNNNEQSLLSPSVITLENFSDDNVETTREILGKIDNRCWDFAKVVWMNNSKIPE